MNKNVQEACKKLTRQQFYNQKQTCINQFSSEKYGKTAPKHDAKNAPEMSLESYYAVSKDCQCYFMLLLNCNCIICSSKTVLNFSGYAPLGRW